MKPNYQMYQTLCAIILDSIDSRHLYFGVKRIYFSEILAMTNTMAKSTTQLVVASLLPIIIIYYSKHFYNVLYEQNEFMDVDKEWEWEEILDYRQVFEGFSYFWP